MTSPGENAGGSLVAVSPTGSTARAASGAGDRTVNDDGSADDALA
jgi:hypothetical protein